MIIIGIILSFVALAYLCWLLFVLAVYALPFFVGTAVALVAYQNGSGPMAAIVIGAIASGVALVAARLAFTTLRSPFVRAVVASVFAIPATLAGYHAALGLAHIGAATTNGWQQAIAVIVAVIVGATAWSRITLSTPPESGGCRASIEPKRASQARPVRAWMRGLRGWPGHAVLTHLYAGISFPSPHVAAGLCRCSILATSSPQLLLERAGDAGL